MLFGETTSMTGDGPLGYYLHKVTGRKWSNGDTEMEAGCGIVPITYKDKSFVHALQWAIGLEWYLLVKDPWRIAMSTDHPNGGSFLAYPEIVQLLMDRTYRQEVLKRVHPRVLRALHAERPGPRILALRDRHHHPGGAGADPGPDEQGPSRPRGRRGRDDLHARRRQTAMFELPRFVIKAGRGRGRAGRNPAGSCTGGRCTCARTTMRECVPDIKNGSRRITRSSSPTTRWTKI